MAAKHAKSTAKATRHSASIPPIPASSRMEIPPSPVIPPPAAPAPAANADPNIYTVAESKEYTAKKDGLQHFVDYVNLKEGQEKLPLTLTFTTNGFQSISCSIAGYPVLDRKTFKSNALVVDMTGNFGSGSSQVLIDAIGSSGGTLNWRLTAPKPTLKSAKPTEVGPGDSVTLTGTNFVPDAKLDVVNFGDKKASVEKATATTLEIKVPDGLESGKQKVSVNVVGQKTKELQLEVSAVPELSGVSLSSAPPGTEITLTGKNFSKETGKNRVTIGGAQAEVVSGSTNSLTVIIPAALDLNMNPAYSVPIVVEVGKQKSKGNVTIDISQRLY